MLLLFTEPISQESVTEADRSCLLSQHMDHMCPDHILLETAALWALVASASAAYIGHR